MSQKECEGQSCALAAVPQDPALPAEHEDQRTTPADEHGTHQPLTPPESCHCVLSDNVSGLFVFAFPT